jgi:ArsR family transcriptional regulator
MRATAAGSVAARDIAQSYAALADPVRWRAVELLSEGPRCVCDLESALGVAQSRLSYHLGVLRDSGLVSARKDGRWMYYSLEPRALDRLRARLGDLADRWRADGAGVEPARCE